MTTPLIIIGAGGYGRELREYVDDAHADGAQYRLEGFLDDSVSDLASDGSDLPILGTTADISSFTKAHFLIALGDPALRTMLRLKVSAASGKLGQVIHPTAQVARSAIVDEGTILCPFCLVAPHAKIAQNVSVNVYASIGHHATIGEDCVISPYTSILGGVDLGDRCFTGAHATVAPRVSVGPDSKVSAGSVATLDLPPGSLAVGNPARSRVMFRSPRA